MPKYRMLYKEELEDLRLEFVRFLSAHSITAQDWEQMKSDNKEESMKWIELFSDMVLDTVLKKIDLLELRTDSEIKFLTIDKENTYMIGLKIDGAEGIKFTANEDPNQMISKFQEGGGELRIITGERPNEQDREAEVFKNMALGYLISKNNGLYDSLKEIVAKKEN